MKRVGEQLGNYRLTQYLSSGGFADVYLAKHKHLDRMAAVKVLNTQLTTEEEKQKFIVEARRLAALEHEHIVRVYEFDIIGGMPFLVMAYASNGTLRERFAQASAISIMPYVRQVADALHFVHNKNLVHRDIKPENILLGANDKVWLADFGIAVEAQQSMRQTALGTIEYIAPEQILGNACPASDQYSLAVVVYAWFCGTLPFIGATDLVTSQHLQNPPPPLRAKNPAISPRIEKVVLQALEKDPRKRFASISAFANALEQAYEQTAPAIISVPESPSNGGGTTVIPGVLAGTPLNRGGTTVIPGVSPTRWATRIPGTCIYIYKGHKDFVQAVSWSPVGLRVASGSNDQVHIWDALTGANMFTYRDHVRRGQIWSLAWSPDGKHIASGTMRQVASISAAMAGDALLIYDKHREAPPSLKFDVKWSADGKYIASGGVDETVHVWDANTGITLTKYQGHSGEITSLSWSPDSTRIASASDDRTIRVWDAITGKNAFVHRGHAQEVYAVAWSPDGKSIASASKDTTVQVWDAATDDRLFTYRGHQRRVKALAWSPNNKHIASVDDDKAIHVWDVCSGKNLLFCCEGHSGLVNALSWSADGQFLVSASNDNTVRIWQMMH